VDAGVAHVICAARDPNPAAAGGATYLRAHGVDVVEDADPARARALNPAWWHAVTTGRPMVTVKTAATVDGRIAAADGTSRWITGPEARAHAHEVRARVDAIVVGTGTVYADDPMLSARPAGAPGGDGAHQPLRVVMGLRDIPSGARIRGEADLFRHLRTHDPAEVLAALAREEVRHVLVEGGGSVVAAFVRADLVDELHAYIAPMFLGAGTPVVADLGVGTLAHAPRWAVHEVRRLGACAWLRAERATTDEQEQ
jgi:diaminohydroxyphosphoribosylaminopyrimidine deaminase/5-amino-6-(5-phosphoribosylamino)uracil reductase